MSSARAKTGQGCDALERRRRQAIYERGIALQMQGGVGGFLVGSVEECAERGRELGLWGREIVRERFLLTRLIADELELYASLLGPGAASARMRDPGGR